ncbi:MAG: HAD family hydrolase [Cyanobacteria bacterium QS_9_48_30]|nr:MAG: HAD family hydrolase [Cyanobacteria bacterium QS_9_48_30]
MPLTPLSETLATNRCKNIRLVATDMDGTLTREGKFTSALFQALEALAEASIEILVVTGRSAGWVNALTSYLPVTGAIAENGGLFYTSSSEAPEILTPLTNFTLHRQQLAETFQFLKTQHPQLQESADNRFRLTDWTFDVQGLSSLQLQEISNLCQKQGWGFIYSTVQCHIKPPQQQKAASLLQVLKQHFPQLTSEQILTVGDSPNDESLFDTSQFPFSVGVANLLDYTEQLHHKPAYITAAAESEGFCELAQLLLNAT